MEGYAGPILAAIFLAVGTAAAAVAQDASFDPNQLPVLRGTVGQYVLDADGDVAGVMLTDGTEVQVSTRDTTELVLVARPGDQVTVHGLRAHDEPMMLAMSITNDRTRSTLLIGRRSNAHDRNAVVEISAPIKARLHDVHGEIDGILLADGTIVNLPLSDVERRGPQLAVGRTIFVSGNGCSNLLGHVVTAHLLGPTKAAATVVASPAVDEEHGGGRRGRGGRGRHRGAGDDD